MKMDTKYFILLLILLGLLTLPVQAQNSTKVFITHGPVLGRLSHDGIGVWVRTSTPAEFRVRLWTDDGILVKAFNGNTALQHDNTGWVHITGLQYNTTYRYEVGIPSSGFSTEGGTFTTLPHADQFRNADHNPKGLFNFSFEFACGNKQEPGILEWDMPVFETMMNKLHGKIHFQIMNGDFIYEDGRELALTEWQSRNRVSDANVPRLLSIAPTLVGVWENYKLYYDRSPNLRRFHRNIPAFFMFDDHEILNDVYGTGSPGIRLRRAVFRDIGVQGWRDYVGWSNPLPQNHQGIHFGRANIHAGSNILEDPDADFTKLDLEQAGTLHVHWDEPTAGSPNVKLDGVGGHPAAGVYTVESILGQHRLQISPPPVANGNRVCYSIGMLNNYRYRIANCDFFVLDTKSHREMHDTNDPWKEGLSMLGVLQKRWLKEGMRNSDADFFFVVSSVNLMVPHVGSGGLHCHQPVRTIVLGWTRQTGLCSDRRHPQQFRHTDH